MKVDGSDEVTLGSLTDPSLVRVVGGLLRRDGRVLLCHRRSDRASYPSVWDLPGGHIEPGESLAEGLRRELAEELGIHVDLSGVAWETARLDEFELNVFLIDHWEGEPSNTAPDEHVELRWVTVDDAAGLELAHPSYPAMLRRTLEA